MTALFRIEKSKSKNPETKRKFHLTVHNQKHFMLGDKAMAAFVRAGCKFKECIKGPFEPPFVLEVQGDYDTDKEQTTPHYTFPLCFQTLDNATLARTMIEDEIRAMGLTRRVGVLLLENPEDKFRADALDDPAYNFSPLGTWNFLDRLQFELFNKAAYDFYDDCNARYLEFYGFDGVRDGQILTSDEFLAHDSWEVDGYIGAKITHNGNSCALCRKCRRLRRLTPTELDSVVFVLGGEDDTVSTGDTALRCSVCNNTLHTDDEAVATESSGRSTYWTVGDIREITQDLAGSTPVILRITNDPPESTSLTVTSLKVQAGKLQLGVDVDLY